MPNQNKLEEILNQPVSIYFREDSIPSMRRGKLTEESIATLRREIALELQRIGELERLDAQFEILNKVDMESAGLRRSYLSENLHRHMADIKEQRNRLSQIVKEYGGGDE